MDPLSSSVSSRLKPTNFSSTPRQLHPLKPLNGPRHFPPPSPQRPLLFSTTKPTTISTSFTHKNLTAPPIFPHPTSLLPSSSLHVHRTPATGYAAALLDTAQSTGSLHEVRRDVRKLSRLLQNSQIQALLNDPFLGDQEKGKAMKELAKKGKFNKHLFNLLKMMVEKNKLGIVSEVLEEFERVYDELIGTKKVWVSSEKMIGEDMLFKISIKVQKLSGAVKVKVKNLVIDKLPKIPDFGLLYT
ncbi:hypothetical protein CXB51_031775 [Gossypium anomalum]|uniref:ATP synthase delta chain, chloroplastic n=1 Tax=Gossypium anomalum TaxID=47600 RepID=A0A8J6CPG9_9ROSI|nr:hypothetical protein CXB51_031775 [Gossypium anomalum]